jgi:hypothetical protein
MWSYYRLYDRLSIVKLQAAACAILVRDLVMCCFTNVPALSTAEFKLGRRNSGLVFVLEPDLFRIRCLPTSSTELYLALIQPSLIGWRLIHIIRHAHLVIEF